jgi:hypothetical protein
MWQRERVQRLQLLVLLFLWMLLKGVHNKRMAIILNRYVSDYKARLSQESSSSSSSSSSSRPRLRMVKALNQRKRVHRT